MRLLNVDVFANDGIPRFTHVADAELEDVGNEFAILSHRWGHDEEEMSFADIKMRSCDHKPGYTKLRNFCRVAASLGCRYAWADTCCINKEDLVELNEAINSMYRWYRRSKVCVVYLKDFPNKHMTDDDWFNRGWTLQELIAPTRAHFFNRNWNFIGTKDELLPLLSEKTGIPQGVLNHDVSLASCSVAQRMSWAANRRTKREEDRAHSLLGILGVNMPSIYGEGEGAFMRLQQILVQQSKDESIFAWSMGVMNDERTFSGLFATSPSAYVQCGDITTAKGSGGFSVANGELKIRLKTFPYDMETYCAVLNCVVGKHASNQVCILVRRTSMEQDDEYVRISGELEGGWMFKLSEHVRGCSERPMRVPINPTEVPLNTTYGFWLRTLEPPGHEGCVRRILSRTTQSREDWVGLEAGK